ncbi:ABC transporter substrate-binding protein [Shewanella dokdonensis]|uniref:ABC transporter substrate-binding protein n=1 Tax=Shewanella dokdonensis TaxID=712036 RepID=A0ABX8DAX7_9GAMM|nr:ABC transporter substrate-binding protein [Shewanella dokdonensis]MCL1075286.1 ABC transporter substrate-binding protein [Shewanella dokdonensis]QVK22004.1 ABC transporter substrate-binding protein [Shewanella dokdonensis]
MLAKYYGAFVFLLASASAVAADEVHTVRYYDNVAVTVPNTVTRVATSWEAQNSILAMLGYGDKIVATTRYARDTPAFQKFVPSIKDAALTTMSGSANINVEQLIALHPDILFASQGFPANKAAQLERAGIAVAWFRANSMDALVERVGLTGKMLGPQAEAKAQAYQQYFARNKALVAERLKNIPQAQRLKVYIASGTPLTTSGRPSLNQDWIDLAGGINIAEHWQLSDVHHGSANVSIESIIAAAPDVIISMRAGDVATMLHKDPRWRNVKAVKNDRVYANPRGLFWWCRETSEEALQFLWLAKLLYPTHFADIDMPQETKQFYQQFYNIHLTDADVADFLHPQE